MYNCGLRLGLIKSFREKTNPIRGLYLNTDYKKYLSLFMVQKYFLYYFNTLKLCKKNTW